MSNYVVGPGDFGTSGLFDIDDIKNAGTSLLL